jgi:PIN domain nuclease of toxin-antitoxin system
VAASYVLDTHACVFMLGDPHRLGARARAALESAESGRAEVFLPAAVVAELLLLRGLGRVGIGLPEIRAAMETSPSLRFLPLELDQLDEFAALGAVRDPFDRLLVSAARSLRARLISRDTGLAQAGLVEVVWS